MEVKISMPMLSRKTFATNSYKYFFCGMYGLSAKSSVTPFPTANSFWKFHSFHRLLYVSMTTVQWWTLEDNGQLEIGLSIAINVLFTCNF